jgi:hypothetical protein
MNELGGSIGSQRQPPTVAQQLLLAGVPLSLLIDLFAPEGPDSAHISSRERPEN